MMGYVIARRIFKALVVCLTLLAIPLVIALIQVVAGLQSKDFPADFYSTTLGWFFLPGASLTGTLGITGALIFLLLLTGIITAIGERRNGGVALKNYLRDVSDKNSDLKPVGFSQQSALISVSVPLDEIFIHLHATTDRPRFDLPTEQLKHLEELRKRKDLTLEQREAEIQALRVVWYSQMGSGLFAGGQAENIDVEYMVEQLTAKQPGAVILGSPGSGKSTTMRWLAYHMAEAARHRRWQRELHILARLLKWATLGSVTLKSALPERMAPTQIPILMRISDYAKVLSKEDSERVTFEDFFKQHYMKTPLLAERLLAELLKGRCLLLLDGLDEVNSDELRRLVAEQMSDFVAHYAPENGNARRFNRFIITSRIVGYEGGTFANYAHYTLQDLSDKQIEQFLDDWCPAVERYQQTFAQGMKKLTPQQTEQANQEGREQKERLWGALQHNPGIKRLAVNPLMLTILALIQRSGKTLPHRRIELYQIVTRTLLDNWNQEKGRRVFPTEEIPLAENMLSYLAYEMHSNDRLLTEAKVKEISGKAMEDFFKQKPAEQRIENFINTLRSSSGLFIETGQGFFSFMHRTFQEYFAAQYLLSLPPDRLEQVIQTRSHKAIWREPLLLLVAYKSIQSSREQQQHASDLIQIILETSDEYDEFLQRNLLLAANCAVDCSAWSIRHDLQRRITNRIFDIYGDNLETGRYTALQQEIERTMLLWLKGQPLESDDAKPPLLDAWYDALCDANQSVRQEGAVHLLATLAPDLPDCPKPVLSILLPPLLQLAEVVEMTSPPEYIRKQLVQTKAQPATLRITDYAIVTLRLLDDVGPAGWLHKEWVQWNAEKPALLEQLTQHALELDYLLTPAALPANYRDPNWDKQNEISKEWKKRAQRNPRELQAQLLKASTAARFPQAWLFKKLLLAETQNIPWRNTWNAVLRGEMAQGKSVMYQACLDLRLLLNKDNEQERKAIAAELQNALSLRDMKQAQALSYIINRDLRDLRYLRYLRDLRYLRYLRDLRDLRYLLD
ncbi:MAG: hypothetical protein H0V70_14415, partial [Ktedonobacteraceae bacterium]|nr:hypothetical protein [Ktedonobacteraceae bacterium]